MENWHAKDCNEVLELLKTTLDGLSKDEVTHRREKFGANTLPKIDPPGIFTILLRQFKSPLIYVLLIAALFSLFVKEYSDAFFIMAVLLLNAVIGGFQEWKAEKGGKALQNLINVKAKVKRRSKIYEVDSEDLVIGDIVFLEAGMRVPADLRLLKTNMIEIDESLLTGESLSVVKDNKKVELDTNLADRTSMSYGGSIVNKGRATGVVVEIGPHTEIGKLAVDVQEIESGAPPLIIRMEKFVRIITLIVLSFSFLLALYGLIFQNNTLSDVFLFAVALAVSAIPEGLPIAMTVALSVGTNRMLKRGVLVRKLSVVEGLGSCTMIATDKTGTLTCNELTVQEIYLNNGEVFKVSGEGFNGVGEVIDLDGNKIGNNENLDDLIKVGVFCNESQLVKEDNEWKRSGDPVDLAFLSLGLKRSIERLILLEHFPEIGQVPYEPENGFAASFHQQGDETLVYVKGAPEKIIKMCGVEDSNINEQVRSMAKRGLRVLAVAKGENKSDLKDLTFMGLVGMMDPPRAEVFEAIKACHKSGIHVAMVTGDHLLTARAIAEELGILREGQEVLSGDEFEEKTERYLIDNITNISVFARVSPNQKLKIVEYAKEAGQFVAVTGDGVNDALALKSANVGVAMGKSGTDVAKEASDIVIMDDNFSSIVSGIEEGRVAYDNIRKVIFLLISTGAGELVLVSLSVIFNLPIPLLPVQLLWLNLVTNGIQDVALAFERGEEGVLERLPRKSSEGIFNKIMVERTIVSALTMGGLAFFTFKFMLDIGYGEDSARNMTLLLMVLFENVHIGNSRSETISAFKLSPFRSPILLFGTLMAFTIHMLAMQIPFFQKVLSVQAVSIREFIYLLSIALLLFYVMELHKFLRNKLLKY